MKLLKDSASQEDGSVKLTTVDEQKTVDHLCNRASSCFFFPLVLPVTVHQSDIAETRQLRFYPDCHYFFSWQV